jgi:hypothetical protein
MITAVSRGNLSSPIFARRKSAAPEQTDSRAHRTRIQPLNMGKRVASNRLASIDGEVRAHEQAHLAAMAGNAQGPVEYDYVMGPDGNMYAVGGSIAVDLKPVPGDPEATLRKAQAIINAAFAPGNPSGADMAVAAAAYQMEMAAKREIEQKSSQADETRHVNLYA